MGLSGAPQKQMWQRPCQGMRYLTPTNMQYHKHLQNESRSHRRLLGYLHQMVNHNAMAEHPFGGID